MGLGGRGGSIHPEHKRIFVNYLLGGWLEFCLVERFCDYVVSVLCVIFVRIGWAEGEDFFGMLNYRVDVAVYVKEPQLFGLGFGVHQTGNPPVLKVFVKIFRRLLIVVVELTFFENTNSGRDMTAGGADVDSFVFFS